MQIDSTLNRPVRTVARIAAVAAFACASAVGLNAQQPGAGRVPSAAQVVAPALDLSDRAGVSYSSSVESLAGVETASLEFRGLPEDASQPPPRRRYGRRRYSDSSHNADGSNKYMAMAGVGIAQPVGNTYHYLNPSYALQGGVGRNFDQHFALVLQVDYDHFGFNGRTLANQSVLYYGATGQGLDGTSHVLSISIDPTFTFYSHQNVGAYVVGGVGFYHKTANFTVPTVGSYCNPYPYCSQYQANETIDKYTSNAPGFNGGFGLTFKPSQFAEERFYVEARYVYIENSQRYGITPSSSIAIQNAYTGSNYYPANSNRTSYLPIKAGIRF